MPRTAENAEKSGALAGSQRDRAEAAGRCTTEDTEFAEKSADSVSSVNTVVKTESRRRAPISASKRREDTSANSACPPR
jgi:hypothetical protein